MYCEFYKKMPISMEWNHKEFKQFTGFLSAGQVRNETFDFWWKDILSAIGELAENPDLQNDMCYTLKVYADKEKRKQIYNEVWTVDFWNEKMVCYLNTPSVVS